MKKPLGQIFKKQGGWTAAALVAGTAVSAYSAKKAGDQQEEGGDKAIAAQKELVGPYVDFGKQQLPGLSDFVSNGANFADTQAYKDIINSQKARGQSLSGNTLTELTKNYATNYRPQRFNELYNVAALGANAATGQASNLGNLHQSQGATNAGATLGVGNAANNGINSLAFLNMIKNNGTQSQVTNLLNQPGNF